MIPLLVLGEEDVRRLLPLDELADALKVALVATSEGRASVPARIAATTRSGWVGAMPGFVPGLGLAAKLVSVFPANRDQGMPSHRALLAVFDDKTGTPVALLGAEHLTAIRTALTAVIAARALMPEEAGDVAVLGAGAQGEAHVVALGHALAGRRLRLWSRDAQAAAELARRRRVDAVLCRSAEEAVRGASVVFCCTDARSPVVEDDWVAAGVHVSSVGSGAELPGALLERSRVVVEHRDAAGPPPAGAPELQGWDPASLIELGEILSGRSPGRRSRDEITVYKSTGHASEDVAAAAVVLRRAARLGAGTTVEL
jgi:ornithine cyclodeaminase